MGAINLRAVAIGLSSLLALEVSALMTGACRPHDVPARERRSVTFEHQTPSVSPAVTSTPEVVSIERRPAKAKALGAGVRHTCALMADRTVRCWGSNNANELGRGLVPKSNPKSATVPGLSDVHALAVGDHHSCAVGHDGQARCWGMNPFGQLGTGSDKFSFAIETVLGLSGLRAVAAGTGHSCALGADGAAHCWGLNQFGQLGHDERTRLPARVAGLAEARLIVVGNRHSCALSTHGAAVCWGANDSGQLGTASVASFSVTPERVVGLNDVVDIAAGPSHTCAVDTDGAAYCWGSNRAGQLGTGTRDNADAPVRVAHLTHVAAITTGSLSTCALRDDGTVHCWGSNTHGKLGDGTFTSSPVPVAVRGISTATAISAGESHCCALSKGGHVSCWGNNEDGQLGDGQSGEGTRSNTPVAVHL